jgi:quercetin dioxygenase-like cupin family protein
MSPKILWLGIVVCLAVGASAQDPIKTEPKHYKLDFENEKVQVVSVHYGPHEKSGLHEHPGGVVVSLTEGHLRFTDENGKTRESYAKPGEVRWYAPFKHRVENLSDTAYDAVYVGIKGASKMSSNAPGTGDEGDVAALDERTKKILAEYGFASPTK